MLLDAFCLEWGEKFEIKKIESGVPCYLIYCLIHILLFHLGHAKNPQLDFIKTLETFLKHVPVYILRRNKNNFFENNVDIKNFIEKNKPLIKNNMIQSKEILIY